MKGIRGVGLALCLLCAPLRAQEKPRLIAQLGHRLHVLSVSISPDGRLVLTGGADATARLWDAATGKEIRRFEGHVGWVRSVAFSADGRFVLTGGEDKTARLWDAATGKEIRRFEGHSWPVLSVSISADGRFVLTGSDDKTARLWDTGTGKETRRFKGHSGWITSVSFSAAASFVLTGSSDGTARLWDAANGEEIRRFEGHSSDVLSVSFSRDDRFVLTAGGDKTARLWDAVTGKQIRRFEGHSSEVHSASFSGDGRFVLTGGEDKTARLWDAATGKQIRRFEGHSSAVLSVSFSADGRFALTGSEDETARLWGRGDRQAEIRRFEGHSSAVLSVAFSADARFILTGSKDNTARLWDAETGKQIRRFEGHSEWVTSVAFSADGRFVLTGSSDNTARLWDAVTGRQKIRFEGHSEWVTSVAFSADGSLVLTGSSDTAAHLWDATTGKEIRRFEGHSGWITSVALSADGRFVLTGAGDRTARLWDAATGKQIRRFQGYSGGIFSVAFSPTGHFVLIGSSDKTARLLDAATGRQIHRFQGHSSAVHSVSFSPAGRFVLTGSYDNTARLWDAATGKYIRSFEGHSSDVLSAAFSADGRFVLTGSKDNTARLWDTASGSELCRLISFLDGTWAVIDSKGRFDASRGGDVDGLHWVVGSEPIALDQLKDRYYEPGLLAKIMGLNKEPLRDVKEFTAPELFPAVELQREGRKLTVRLKNRGGGIGRVVIRINGKERTADARGPRPNEDAEELTIVEDLTGDPRIVPGRRNRIEVFAYNKDGYLRSRGSEDHFVESGEPKQTRLWAVVAGVSEYRGSRLDLRFAAKDAEDFSKAIRAASTKLFGAERTNVKLLMNAKRQHIIDALDALSRSVLSSDILVLYLAGHGVNRGGDFFYLTSEAVDAQLTDPALRKSTAISSRILTEKIRRIPALKQVLILDTCASGGLIRGLTEVRAVSSGQLRALERVKDRMGMFVLAGCAADKVSYEATRYGQGLLTYSLLLGMKGGALREEQYVDVGTLFGFVADNVPMLATGIGGVQRPVVAVPRGGSSFDLGQLDEAGKKQVPLQSVRPLFVRALFLDTEELDDVVGLSKRVDDLLSEAAARGRDARLVFLPVRSFPQAHRITGGYATIDGKLKVRFKVRRGEHASDWLEVEGKGAVVAKRIVEAARAAAKKLGK